MAIVTISDVQAAIKAHWDGDPSLAVLVPGGLHDQRIPQTQDMSLVMQPYAKLKVTEASRQYNSSQAYIGTFTILLTVWSQAGNVDAGKIVSAISLRFDRGSAATVLMMSGADAIIDLRPVNSEAALDDVVHESRDQVMGTLAWELVLQATVGR